MKKVTLIFIIFFASIVGVVYLYAFLSGVVQTSQGDKTLKVVDRPKDNKIQNSKKLNVDKNIKLVGLDIAKFKNSLIYTNNSSTISLAEVAKHTTKDDCYLIINKKIYNVSGFLQYHPAGSRIILQYCGQEVTGIFARIHSNRAWDLLAKYKIGSVASSVQSAIPQVLQYISNSLIEQNPSARVVKVSPKKQLYIAKVIFDNKLYEVHIDSSGRIVQQEVADAENWRVWEVDRDDN